MSFLYSTQETSSDCEHQLNKQKGFKAYSLHCTAKWVSLLFRGSTDGLSIVQGDRFLSSSKLGFSAEQPFARHVGSHSQKGLLILGAKC